MTNRIDLIAPLDAADHTLGPADAPVTLVEYGDFQCPVCKLTAPVIKQLLEKFDGKLRFVYRHFPLVEIHHHALLAAQAAEAAGRQGKFWEMHDLLFGDQNHLDAFHFRGHASRLSLNERQFSQELEFGTHATRVQHDIQTGRESGVRSTPGLFINGQIYDPSFGLASLHDRVGSLVKGAAAL
jgi:protein-disulfide isomerase